MKSFVKSKVEAPIQVESITQAAGEAPIVTQHDPITDTAVAVASTGADKYTGPAVSASVMSSPYVSGEVSSSDIKKPYLGCVQNVGPKSQMFLPGTIVIGDVAICKAPTELKVPSASLRIIFGFVSKAYVEWLKYDPSPAAPKPKVFQTTQQVRENGGTLEWRGNIQPTYYPRATCAALVQQPDGCINEEPFSYIDGDDAYAAVMLSFQRTGYGAAKTLFTDLDFALDRDPTKTFYTIVWNREVRGGNLVWVPSLTRVRDEVPSDSLRARVRALTGVVSHDDYEE